MFDMTPGGIFLTWLAAVIIFKYIAYRLNRY